MVNTETKENFIEFIDCWNQEQGMDKPPLHEKIAGWLERSWLTGRTRLLLMAFRSSGKSTLVGLFSAWLLYKRPELRILVLAADYALAKKMVRNVKRIIELHPLTHGMKPKKADQWASDRFTVERELELRDPSMLARGIGTNITGSRADFVICDDVEVPNTADTAEKRADLRERLLEISYVLVPGGTELYVGTPHSYYTLYQTEEEGLGSERDAFLKGYRYLKLPVLDEAGESVWPEKFTSEALARMKEKTGPNKFASQMMLEPVNLVNARLDPGLLIRYEDDLDYAREIQTLFIGRRKLCHASAWWDPAFGKRGGDSSVLACIFSDEEGRYFLHHLLYINPDDAEGDEATAQSRQVAGVAKALYLPSLTIETNGIGGFLPAILRNEMARARVPCRVNAVSSHRPKDLRILEAFDAVMAARHLHVHSSVYDTPFIREMREWSPDRKSARDDGLDAVAGALSQQPVRIRRLYGRGNQSWMHGRESTIAKTDFNPRD